MTTTPQTNTTLGEIAQVIRDHDDFVLCGHVSPDGDCLGSQLTLHHALQLFGKRSVCVLVRDEPVGEALSFMPGMQGMVPAKSYDGPCEVFIGLDVPNRERIGEATRLLDRSEVSITIDHHASDTTMCDYVFVDPDCAATSMLVWELAKLLVGRPSLESATCAYTGLVTDTGGFCFLNTDVAAFAAASELVSYGVNPAYVAMQSMQNRSIASLQLERLVIERLQLLADEQVSLSWVRTVDFERYGATKADAEPLIEVVRSLHGVRVACMLREQDGKIRGSVRAKDATDVSALARELGGGGHKAAAGFTLDQTLDEAIEFVGEKLCQLVSN